MDKKYKIAIIGGGASGLILASSLLCKGGDIALFERADRVGKKLSATGNGQGNITNASVASTPYFSSSQQGKDLAKRIVGRFDAQSLCAFFHALGVKVFFDERGRGYPTSRQASALTDALRFCVQERGVQAHIGKEIVAIEKRGETFLLTASDNTQYAAEKVVLCTGGKAAKNFGTDGGAYALAQGFGHTMTKLYPSLVQLKTDTANIRTLKGIRVFDTKVTATWREKDGEKKHTVNGDIMFTDYGVSGDAVFRLSAFIADKQDAVLSIDFLPDVDIEELTALLKAKKTAFPTLDKGERLCGIVNNQVGRAIVKSLPSATDEELAARVKAFPLSVKGSLGFDYAQVTKGGVNVLEVDENLQSQKAKGLYFAGEILDIDGECGGFNLQWAFSSARTVAAAIDEELKKGKGQVCV